ncbi:MAG: B12-binding domain-containing radical SAM protein [Deltaproteobacteria bacterium]|nr:B12-binding domain-containing radical SAM protein [Deltaproteobacteria bacterium]
MTSNLFFNSPPLGILYMAAVLEEDGHQVTVTDASLEGHGPDDLAKMGRDIQPDLVGIGATTTYFENASATAKALRRYLPDARIGVGGPHLTGNTDVLLGRDEFDFGVIGEGEIAMKEIAGHLRRGESYRDVHGVVTRSNGSLHFAPARPLNTELDELPFPARHLLPIHKYRPMPGDQHILPKTSMIGSRGCPFKCTFCDKQTFGPQFRGHSPERIVREMHYLKNEFGVRDVAFVDSVFTPNRRRVSDMMDAMEADPPGLTWSGSCRANVLDRELLTRMRKMGAWRVRIAIESGDDEILDRIRKGIKVEDFKRTARIAAELGFDVKVFFMVGHPGETPETIDKTIKLAKSLPLKDVTVQINTPLKGTAQYEEVDKWGTMLDVDAAAHSFFEPVFVPNGMTAKMLVNAQRRFYREFYLRPSVIWRHLRKIRCWADITKFFRAAPLLFTLIRPSGK